MHLISIILLAFTAHEGGHFTAALFCGYRLRFYRAGFRLVWNMPSATPAKQRLIAQTGFGGEFLVGLLLLVLFGTEGAWITKSYLIAYWSFAVLHFLAYPWYASGEHSDFKWMR